MSSKILTALLLVAVMVSTAACGGAAPEAELRQAILRDYHRENEHLAIVSAKKAPNPEFFPAGFAAPPEEVWCVVTDRSSNPNIPWAHYLVVKRGLLYSNGFATGDEYMRTLFLQVGCDNY
jgi:hypothetical protein